MFDLKIDDELPHHYLISVAIHPITAGKKAGQLFLKYGPLYFHNTDVKNLQNALILSKDKLLKTTENEALKIHNVTDLVRAISAMRLASKSNNATVHHFSCALEVEEKYFETIVESANKSNYFKDLLLNARIRDN